LFINSRCRGRSDPKSHDFGYWLPKSHDFGYDHVLANVATGKENVKEKFEHGP
jgi:hypothetical protein